MLQWFNPPAAWDDSGGALRVMAAPKTDFWRKTHADFIADNGHFYYQTVPGDFSASVQVTAAYRDLYDQAGLMLRIDSHHWLKCGVEYMNGQQYASTVVTRDFSDWSVVTIPNPPTFWLKLRRYGHTVEVEYSLDGAAYTLMRQAYLPPVDGVQVGPMVCAPQGRGFEAVFHGFQVTTA